MACKLIARDKNDFLMNAPLSKMQLVRIAHAFRNLLRSEAQKNRTGSMQSKNFNWYQTAFIFAGMGYHSKTFYAHNQSLLLRFCFI